MSSETRGICGAECRDESPCLNLAIKCPHHDESDRPADPKAVVSDWERDESEDASASRPAGPTTRYRVRCPGCGYSDRFRSKGNAIRVQKHGCPECGRGIGVSKVRADPDNQQLVTDGGTDTRRESEVTFHQAICTTCDTRMTPRRVKSRAKTDRKAHKEKDHQRLPHVRIVDFESEAIGPKALDRPDYDEILDDGGDA